MSHTADCIVEAWGPDRISCMTEALDAMVEGFAQVPDPVTTSVMPLAAERGSAEAILVSLLEDVIFAVDVFSVVPVRFHLAEAQDGGVGGDMDVVRLDQVEVVGPEPKGASYHELSMTEQEGEWSCRVLIDV